MAAVMIAIPRTAGRIGIMTAPAGVQTIYEISPLQGAVSLDQYVPAGLPWVGGTVTVDVADALRFLGVVPGSRLVNAADQALCLPYSGRFHGVQWWPPLVPPDHLVVPGGQ